MIEKQHIINLIEEKIDGTDIFIVSVSVSRGNDIYVVMDADSGINIDKCIAISRQIEHNLDRESEDFSLEVGSFVLGHPFQLMRQYKKYLNKKIEVTLNDGTKLKGILLQLSEKELELEQELTKKKIKEGLEPKIKISFEEIKESKAVISFN